MSKLMNTEPGWLNKTIQDSFISICMKYMPMEYIKIASNIGQNPQVTLPVTDEIAAEMYKRMNAHFYAWTGKTLHEWDNEWK